MPHNPPLGDDVDERLAVDAERHGPPQFGIVEWRRVAVGQHCRLGSGEAEGDRRRELLQLFGFLGPARLRRQPPGKAGEHLDHGGRRARARAHGAAFDDAPM
jgi:hypothetical protein